MFVITLGLFVVMKLYFGKHKVIIIDRKDSQTMIIKAFLYVFNRVKLPKMGSVPGSRYVCYVNYEGEVVLQALNQQLKGWVLVLWGLCSSNQWRTASFVPQERLTTLGGKVTKHPFPHPCSLWAPFSSSNSPSIHPSISKAYEQLPSVGVCHCSLAGTHHSFTGRR